MAKFAFVWFVFLGAAMVTRRSRHIVIDLLPRSLGPDALRVHAFAVRVISASVAAFLLIYGADLVSKSTFTSPALQWSYAYLYLAMPVSAAISLSCWRSSRSTACARAWSGAAATARASRSTSCWKARAGTSAVRLVRRGLAAGHHGDRPDAARRSDRRRADLRHLRGLPAAGRAGAAAGAAGHGQLARLPAARDPVLHAGRRHDECRRHHREADRARDARWSAISAAGSGTSTCSPTR